MDCVEACWATSETLTADDTTQAFWYACHGGQQSAAAYLLQRGADLNWISSWDHHTPLDAARRSGADELTGWLRTRGGRSADEVNGPG